LAVLLVSVQAIRQAIDERLSLMARIILVTGGARSGKSAIAEGHALGFTGRATYIATAQAFDTEMEQRIAAHQARRGPEWSNLHAPFDLADALRESDNTPCLVDCLTLWLTNIMLAERDWQAQGLLEAWPRASRPWCWSPMRSAGASCPTMLWRGPFAIWRACSTSASRPWPMRLFWRSADCP
jgi:hypothetical protein